MLLSMTGFGRGEATFDDKTVVVEVRSLNSKLTDIRIKSSLHMGQRELDLRKLVQDHATRGKIDVMIDLRGMLASDIGSPNTQIISKYYNDLKEIADDLGVENEMIFSSILKLPNVFHSENGEMDDEMWAVLQQTTRSALDQLKVFRSNEGQSLLEDLESQASTILDLLDKVTPEEADREEALRVRLRQRVEEMESEAIDQNRVEQELLHYLDKLDINEEKVRLRQHCEYFLAELAKEGEEKGKKLNFISQEIGREINTLGSKAQWSPIQRIVVQMKNALEKIKEQLANVL